MDLSLLTEEEKVIIRDCQRKNFWGRALPLSLGAMAGCHFLVLRGIIQRSIFKTLGFGLGGYILGRISLPSQIKERLMKEAPDGAFARMAREVQNMSVEEKREFLQNLRHEGGPQVPPQWEGIKGTGPLGSGSAPDTQFASVDHPQHKPVSSTDNYPHQTQDAVDVRLKPIADYDADRRKREDMLEKSPQRFSYAEQRKLNTQAESGAEFSPDSKLRSSEDFKDMETPQSAQSNRKTKKNIYGDEME